MEEQIKYERKVSLRTIYLTLIRRTEMILAIFLPLVLVSFIITNYTLQKTYTSSAVFNNGSAISQANYSSLQLSMTTSDIFTNTATNLKNNNIKHANGSSITELEIKSGLSFASYSSNMVSFKVSFNSSDSSITKQSLSEYAKVALLAMGEKYPSLGLYGEVSSPEKTSTENRYFLISVVASAILALGIPFAVEIVLDQVYERKDIDAFGANGFEIFASGK